ncbi:MAG: glycosyltransferase, partial [Pseudomonadota bacterium]
DLAWVSLANGETAGAAACFERSLTLDPQHSEAELGEGVLGLSKSQCNKQQQWYFTELALRLGDRELLAGRLHYALRYLRAGLLFEPTHEDLRYWQAIVLQDLGEFAKAQPLLAALGDDEPEDGRALLALASIRQQDDVESAAQLFKQGLRRNYPYLASRLSKRCEQQTLDQSPQETIEFSGNRYPKINGPKTIERRPFWSVVIPVYGRSRFLPECLASVLNQYPGSAEMEVVVLDNGTQPPLRSLVGEVAGSLVRYYRREHTVSLQQNWNDAVSLSRGYWVHLLHDDDLVLGGFYATLGAAVESAGSSLGGASCGYELIDDRNRVLGRSQIRNGERGIAANWIQDIGVANLLNPPCPVIRREAYENLGAYRTDFLYTIDWELYMRIASRYDWWLEPAHLARYRIHGHNVSSEQQSAGIPGEAFITAINLAESYLPDSGHNGIARRARSASAVWCLRQAGTPLRQKNYAGTWRILRASVELDSSQAWLSKVDDWLLREQSAGLRKSLIAAMENSGTVVTWIDPHSNKLPSLAKDQQFLAVFLNLNFDPDTASSLFFTADKSSQ